MSLSAVFLVPLVQGFIHTYHSAEAGKNKSQTCQYELNHIKLFLGVELWFFFKTLSKVGPKCLELPNNCFTCLHVEIKAGIGVRLDECLEQLYDSS